MDLYKVFVRIWKWTLLVDTRSKHDDIQNLNWSTQNQTRVLFVWLIYWRVGYFDGYNVGECSFYKNEEGVWEQHILDKHILHTVMSF